MTGIIMTDTALVTIITTVLIIILTIHGIIITTPIAAVIRITFTTTQKQILPITSPEFSISVVIMSIPQVIAIQILNIEGNPLPMAIHTIARETAVIPEETITLEIF